MAKKQFPPDPRQELCLSYYFDPKSKTFGDLKNSAVHAGFTVSYADNLFALLPEWLSDAMGQHKMLSKAERNLDNMLDLKENSEGKLRVKADITKFIAERLGKRKYAQRKENINLDILKTIIIEKSNEPNSKDKTLTQAN